MSEEQTQHKLEGEDLENAFDVFDAVREEAGEEASLGDLNSEQLTRIAVGAKLMGETDDADDETLRQQITGFMVDHEDEFAERYGAEDDAPDEDAYDGPLSAEEREAYAVLNSKDAEAFLGEVKDSDALGAYLDLERANKNRAFVDRLEGQATYGTQSDDDPDELDEGQAPEGDGGEKGTDDGDGQGHPDDEDEDDADDETGPEDADPPSPRPTDEDSPVDLTDVELDPNRVQEAAAAAREQERYHGETEIEGGKDETILVRTIERQNATTWWDPFSGHSVMQTQDRVPVNGAERVGDVVRLKVPAGTEGAYGVE